MTQESRHIERLRGIVKFLDNTAKNTLLYPTTHPSVRAPAKRMKELLDEVFAHKEEVILGIINDVLYVEDYFFYDPTPHSREILNCLARFGAENLALVKGFNEEEILALSKALKSKGEGRETFQKLLAELGARRVLIRDYRLGTAEAEDITAKSLESYRGAVTTINTLFNELRSGQLPPMREAEGVVDRFMDLVPSHRSVLLLLTSLKGYDSYTYQHCVNVGILSLLLGEAMGMAGNQLRHTAMAGLLHDIGKVKVPEAVLKKAGYLSPVEWDLMRRHSNWSADIVSGMGGDGEIVHGVLCHHVNHDGSGYPALSAAESCGDIARIVAVADVYDAMTTVRSYKDPVDPMKAVGQLDRLKGSRLDPGKVDLFQALLGLYPPGCLVRLSTNEIVRVVRPGKASGRPIIRKLLDPSGLPLVKPMEVDLTGPGGEGLLVAGIVEPVLYGLESGGVTG